MQRETQAHTQTDTRAHVHTNPRARTHHSEKQHNVNSPLQRDVLLIGLSLVTVWEDDLSQRFLCRVVTGTSLF